MTIDQIGFHHKRHLRKVAFVIKAGLLNLGFSFLYPQKLNKYQVHSRKGNCPQRYRRPTTILPATNQVETTETAADIVVNQIQRRRHALPSWAFLLTQP